MRTKYNRVVNQGAMLNESHRISTALTYFVSMINYARQNFFEEYGLTPQKFRLLFLLQNQFNGKSISKQLKEYMTDENPDMSRLITHLTISGFIEKQPAIISGKRIEILIITKKATDTLESITKSEMVILKPMSALNNDDKVNLLNIIEKMVRATEGISYYSTQQNNDLQQLSLKRVINA